jgi:hypothetical protein
LRQDFQQGFAARLCGETLQQGFAARLYNKALRAMSRNAFSARDRLGSDPAQGKG